PGGAGHLRRRARRGPRPGRRGRPGHGPRARGTTGVPRPQRGRQPDARRLARPGEGRRGPARAAGLRHLPPPGRAAQPARRVAVGGRAADAGHRPGADVGAEASADRRVEPRPVADRRRRPARPPPGTQRRRAEPRADRAVRPPGPGHRRPRLPAGQGPGAVLGNAAGSGRRRRRRDRLPLRRVVMPGSGQRKPRFPRCFLPRMLGAAVAGVVGALAAPAGARVGFDVAVIDSNAVAASVGIISRVPAESPGGLNWTATAITLDKAVAKAAGGTGGSLAETFFESSSKEYRNPSLIGAQYPPTATIPTEARGGSPAGT